MRHVATLLVIGACATPVPDDSSSPTDPAPDAAIDPLIVDDQSPPTSHSQLVDWLAAGSYLAWACEPEPHPARPPGAHGSNRICSNTLLSTTSTGPYPVGAATVKELVRDGEVTGYAVMRKLAADDRADSWYWYEAYGNSVLAEGRSPGICTGCHSGAPRDFIFTRVE